MKSDTFKQNTSDSSGDLLIPPNGLWAKSRYYAARYGCLHAISGYIGRKWLMWWLWVGPIVTRKYLERWLVSPGPHILNLGGGGVLSDRWLTADITPRADVFMDITKVLPLPASSVDVVYSEEVIEHIDREAGQRMLTECLRVLKPGGILRITTPSLDYFAKNALDTVDGVKNINDIFYLHEHRFIYSEFALRLALREAGFINISQSSYRDANSKHGSFDSHPARFAFAPPEWSQYWEAQKATDERKP